MVRLAQCVKQTSRFSCPRVSETVSEARVQRFLLLIKRLDVVPYRVAVWSCHQKEHGEMTGCVRTTYLSLSLSALESRNLIWAKTPALCPERGPRKGAGISIAEKGPESPALTVGCILVPGLGPLSPGFIASGGSAIRRISPKYRVTCRRISPKFASSKSALPILHHWLYSTIPKRRVIITQIKQWCVKNNAFQAFLKLIHLCPGVYY